MNLLELEITKDVRERYVDWRTVFEKHGWTVLGTGTEGTVGTKPGASYVLKAFPSYSSAPYFVEFCEKYRSPHLVKFSRNPKPVPGAYPPTMYVRMELLQQISWPELQRKYFPEIAYAWIACDRHSIIMNWRWHDRIRDLIEGKFGQSAYSLKDDDKSRELLWSKVGTPSDIWQDTIDKMIEFLMTKTQNTEIDLHPGNFMLRGHTLVIIDAYSTFQS